MQSGFNLPALRLAHAPRAPYGPRNVASNKVSEIRYLAFLPESSPGEVHERYNARDYTRRGAILCARQRLLSHWAPLPPRPTFFVGWWIAGWMWLALIYLMGP